MFYGETKRVEANFVRPGNTTAYASGDVVGDGANIIFAKVARELGRGGVIVSAELIDEAAPATKLDCELFLFRVAPTVTADNAAWAISNAQLRDLVGVIDFTGTPYIGQASTNCVYQSGSSSNLPIGFQVAAGDSDLYGVLVARNAYVPISAERFNIALHILQD